MAEYLIKETTLTGIADAIRAKTGSTDPIPVADMAAQIGEITGGGGGGSVEGIVYVTFMNGNTELCKTACMVGDCSIDPVECAKIAVPTKEPTVDTVYTFSGGWALTDGGTADAAALVDVSEDRTVYAAYNESVRYYTVRFFDGETLLHTEQVAYGGTVEYTPEDKDGLAFDSWNPAPETVTSDMDCYASWFEAPLASGTCGDSATWSLSQSGVLTISGTGAMTDFSRTLDANYNYYGDTPWKQHVLAITQVIVSDGITSIGAYSFYQCSALASVTIADSVTIVGQGAFWNCTTLTAVTIPDSVTTIGDNAFYQCANLASVIIGNGVTRICYQAFRGCDALASITLPSALETIEGSAFRSCDALTSVTIPDSVTTIGDNAFSSCSGLTRVTIGSSVTSIGKWAFSNENITYVKFKDTTTWYVGASAGATTTAVNASDLSSTGLAATYLTKSSSNASNGKADSYWTKL